MADFKHHVSCECPTCAARRAQQPAIPYTWYQTKFMRMEIESVALHGTTWVVYYRTTVIGRGQRYAAPSRDIEYWTADMWNKYARRWHENGGEPLPDEVYKQKEKPQ